MKYTISYESEPRHEDIQMLYDGLKDHMIGKRDLKPISFFGYFIKDENDKIVGGCNGCIMYGCLVVDTLWVAESLRGQGYGTKLMQKAERIGMENECRFVSVNIKVSCFNFYSKIML